MPEKNKPAKRTKVQAVPKQPKEIGIDLDKTLQSDILEAAQTSSLDLSDINDFNNIAQNRENIYNLIDTMAQDDTISSILETYAEDMVEPNDKGQIVWVESSDDYIAKYVQFLLDSLNVDKHIYSWAQSLITYGDLYIKLFRESDVADDPVFQHRADEPRSLNESSVEKQLAAVDDKPLKEDINLNLYHDNDHYIHYVEMVPNPSEMFELTKFGKTAGYIKASVASQHTYDASSVYSSYIKYKMKKSDITIYDATDFVHACLDNKLNRSPETVDIYFDDKSYDGGDTAKASSYTVKRGQSILSNAFRVWRELSLLENSVLLSRLTKSSIVRILNVDVGDMPKSQVKNFMSRLKAQIEQKSAINVGNSMQEYTNPGAIENVIYVPTHGTQGAITASSIGGDVDPKQLTDLDWFNNKLYGAFKVPKAYFGWTDDGAGFNGGTSLSIISSRYGKTVKRLQNTLCQMVTDIINLFLYDKHLDAYINKFTIRMQAPLTQEEIDRRENKSNRIRYVSDVMSQLSDVSDPKLKLKILKAMLSSVVNDPEVLGYIQDQIDQLEAEESAGEDVGKSEPTEPIEGPGPEPKPSVKPMDLGVSEPELKPEESERGENNVEPMEQPSGEAGNQPAEDSYLPNPSELGFDATANG